MKHQVELTVTGPSKIHCESCEQRIGRALQRMGGVEGVAASAITQKVQVTIDPARVTPEQVRAKLQDIGYEAELAG